MNHLGEVGTNEGDTCGLIVSSVQSGKTLNYSALICKAADAGYKFFVVLTTDHNNLRTQTQRRIEEYFVGKKGSEFVGVGRCDNDSDKQPICLTGDEDFDIKKAKNSTTTFDNVKTPIVMVIKKNARNLQNVIKWLNGIKHADISAHSMFVLDDEADYASINTKSKEEQSTINKLIRKLLDKFKNRSYVGCTATPFANIFIDDDETQKDLFPRDFIHFIKPPSNYFGAQKAFCLSGEASQERQEGEESQESEGVTHAVEVADFEEYLPLAHKKDFLLTDLPPSLYEAVRVFLLNTAVRHLRGQNKHNSMLINITRFTNVHNQIYYKVAEFIEQIECDLPNFGKLQNAHTQSEQIAELKELFEREFSNEFSWQQVLGELARQINRCVVAEEDASSTKRIEYGSEPKNVIAVGGNSLSRGFTLEGLSVSYFIRRGQNYDTLMQMARWFGYRDGYEDLCRIYLPSEVEEKFVTIERAMAELMGSFEMMAEAGKTPEDFGLAVKFYPDVALQITAHNKMRSAKKEELIINFNDYMRENLQFKLDEVKGNVEVMKSFLTKHSSLFGKDGNIFIARGVESRVVLEFFEKFSVASRNVPVLAIKELLQTKNPAFDIAIYSGNGEEIRFGENICVKKQLRPICGNKKNENIFRIEEIDDGRMLLYALDASVREEVKAREAEVKASEEQFKAYIRQKMERPLLMLHILEVKKGVKRLQKGGTVASFGVCFPAQIGSEVMRTKVALNAQAQRELQELSEWEDEDE